MKLYLESHDSIHYSELSVHNGRHPHINGQSICLGNNGDLILNTFKASFDSGYLILYNLLCNYGSRPYFNINSFDITKKLCVSCLNYKKPAYNKEFCMCTECVNAHGLVHKKEYCIKCESLKSVRVGSRVLKKGFICNEH